MICASGYEAVCARWREHFKAFAGEKYVWRQLAARRSCLPCYATAFAAKPLYGEADNEGVMEVRAVHGWICFECRGFGIEQTLVHSHGCAIAPTAALVWGSGQAQARTST